MKAIWILAGGLVVGFGSGFVVRDLTTGSPDITSYGGAGTKGLTWSRDQDPGERNGGVRRHANDNRGNRAEGDRRDRRDERERRTRPEALAAFREAIDGGDRGAMHDALRDLTRRSGEPLSTEQLEELGSLLHEVDNHTLEELSRALVMSGGKEGVALVMAFVEDSNLSLDARERALHGMSRVPREMAEAIYPALADFLESGPPSRLQHSAARAIGHLFKDQAADALLGLLEERPGIRPDVIFSALGDTGKLEDTETLLGMLSANRSGREKMGLLRAIGRISTRRQDADFLLEMMRNPPGGVSKSMIAQAIGDSSHHLSTGFLKEALLEVSGDPRAQERIARAMTENGGKAGFDALLEIAGDPDYDFDSRALARSLHNFRNKEALPFMMDMLKQSRDEEILEPLARGMLRNGSRETVDQLMGLLEEGNESQRRSISRSLHDADRDSIDMDRLVTALRNEQSREVGSEIARSISRMYGDRGVQEVVSLLESSSEMNQRHALMWGLEEAWRRDSSEARDVFVKLATNDPAEEIRRHAVEIIEHRRDPSMIPTLEKLLSRESSADVQQRLREAIRKLSR